MIVALCAGCALLAANVLLGDLNQDEGWYLYAARLVRAGGLPYRDFAYTQAPVLPFVYAATDRFVEVHGLLAGRVFTALLAFVAALMAAALAARISPRGLRIEAAALALVLILVNVYHAYFCAVVKTYALTSFFLLAGLLALTIALDKRSRATMMLSAVLFTFAAGTRSSASLAAAAAFVFLCLDRNSRGFIGWFWFALGGAAASALVVIPFLVMAPEGFWFCAVAYHAMRDSSGGLLQTLVYKAGFLSRVLNAYFVAIGLWVAVLLARAFRLFPFAPREDAESTVEADGMSLMRGKPGLPFALLLWAIVAAVSLVHFMAPFPYDDYQVFIFPVFAVAVAVSAVRLMSRANASYARRCAALESENLVAVDAAGTGSPGAWLLGAVLVLCLGASLSSPINQDWFVQERDRIWWRLKDNSPLRKLQQTGAMIRSLVRPGDLLLTQDPYLAVEAGLTLPRGLEMGQFCYFPDFSDDEAKRLHVMNRARLTALIRDCAAPVAALSGYAFAISSPQIEPTDDEEQAAFWHETYARYEPVLSIPDFGQAFTTLQVFRKRD